MSHHAFVWWTPLPHNSLSFNLPKKEYYSSHKFDIMSPPALPPALAPGPDPHAPTCPLSHTQQRRQHAASGPVPTRGGPSGGEGRLLCAPGRLAPSGAGEHSCYSGSARPRTPPPSPHTSTQTVLNGRSRAGGLVSLSVPVSLSLCLGSLVHLFLFDLVYFVFGLLFIFMRSRLWYGLDLVYAFCWII